MKEIKLALSTSEGRLKAFILISGLIILVLVLMAGDLGLTSTPSFCKSCHEMNPEYYTWQGSAHNQIPCVKCHIKPGAVNYGKYKLTFARQVYLHFTGSYVSPIELKDKIEDTVCLQCHDMDKRVTTPSGDIKFPHSKHLVQQLDCVDCHGGVVHGSIESKGFTALTDYDRWNSYVGKSYVNSDVSKYFTRLTMDQCMKCHSEKNAPQTCETCHSKLIRPEDHKAAEWQTAHGPKAFADIKACDKCHAVTSKYRGVIPQGLTIKDYARNNTFCNSCHSNTPTGHDAMWRKNHISPAKDNRILCLVCHNEAGPKMGDKVPAKVTCQTCHVKDHGNFRLTHPIQIPATGYSAICSGCHNRCDSCHISINSP